MSTRKPPNQPGCVWVEDCIEICTGRSVYVDDQGVRATFSNPQKKKIRKVRYDACYFTGPGRQADYIVGLPGAVDVIVELKGTDANLKDAALQVESTLERWKQDPKAERVIAALIVYGRIEGKKKLPGRVPRVSALIQSLTFSFLKEHKRLLLIKENGKTRFAFKDFLQRSHAS